MSAREKWLIEVGEMWQAGRETRKIELEEEFGLEEGKEGEGRVRVEGRLRLRGVIQRVEDDLVFKAERVRVEVGVECERCLEEYKEVVDLKERRAVFVREKQRLEEGEEVYLYSYVNKRLDLWQFLYEEVMLALPLRKVCKEGCRGLCEKCGVNLNKGECGCEREKGGEKEEQNPFAGLEEYFGK